MSTIGSFISRFRLAFRPKRRTRDRDSVGFPRAEGAETLTDAEYRAFQSMHPAFRPAFARACTEGRASYAYARFQHEEHSGLVRARCYWEASEIGDLIREADESLQLPMTMRLKTRFAELRQNHRASYAE